MSATQQKVQYHRVNRAGEKSRYQAVDAQGLVVGTVDKMLEADWHRNATWRGTRQDGKAMNFSTMREAKRFVEDGLPPPEKSQA